MLNVNVRATISNGSPSEEDLGGVFDREGNGLRLLGCKRHCDHWLPSERPNYQWRILSQCAEAAVTGNQDKTALKTDKGVLFHLDNDPAHKSMVAVAAVCDCGFELVDHSTYFSDLAPSDNFCFLTWKNTWLGGTNRPMIISYLLLRTSLNIKARASMP